MKRTGFLVGMALLVRMVCSTSAAEIAVKVSEKEPPQQVGETIRKTLQPKAIQLLDNGKTLYEFWLRSATPVKAKPESASKGLQALEEITLLGVATVGEGRRDYKDGEIPPGTYTMRFGLQPQDGDHLGTSDHPFFIVLIPADSDKQMDGIKTYKAMVKASSKAAPAGHPIVLSLFPPSDEGGALPETTSPAPEHHAVRMKLPVKAPDSAEASTVVFDLVIEGRFKG